METSIKLISKIFVGIALFIFINVVFIGTTTQASEGDSLAYHIPIANSFLDGSIIDPSHIKGSLGYYPASNELILAFFSLIGIPLNLFNVVAWLILIMLCINLGRVYQLKHETSLIFSVTTMSVLSFIHLLPNQTIDIWLAVFFVWSVILLKKPSRTLSYALKLGISLGMLLGSKYTGPAFVILLLILFKNRVFPNLSIKGVIVFIVPFTILGLFWYIRNFILTGNPIYPQSFLFFQGDPSFELMKWTGIQTILFIPFGIFKMGFAIFSEYLLWSVTPFIAMIAIFSRSKIVKSNQDIKQLALLGLFNFVLFFFMPSTPDNIITYLRYLFPAFIPLILCTFILAKSYNVIPQLSFLAVINSMLILTQFPYRPKLFLIFFLILTFIIIITDQSIRKAFIK